MQIYWKIVLQKTCNTLYLKNGSYDWAEILGLFLTMLGLPTVKISVKSVTSIEQPSAVTGSGLRAIPPRNWENTYVRFLLGKLRKAWYFGCVPNSSRSTNWQKTWVFVDWKK